MKAEQKEKRRTDSAYGNLATDFKIPKPGIWEKTEILCYFNTT